MSIVSNNKVYKVDQLADQLQCSEQTIRKLISSGKLKSIKISARLIVIPADSLNEYLNSLNK